MVRSMSFKLLLVCILILSVISFSLINFADASENSPKNNEIPTFEEVNEEVNFMYEEAVTYDENNNPLGIDYNKVEKRYGTIPQEYKQLERDITKTRAKAKEQQQSGTSTRAVGDNYDGRWDCNAKEIANQVGSSIPPAVISAVIDYWQQGQKQKAFKKIIKSGLRGNAVGIAYTIISTDVQCTMKYGYL
ncbi:hypothetical protein K4S31_11725 [Staphylococcus epidermidis]|nr:hypothetical protein [Staphylococcus epidermidis]MCG2396439.1 hypothetical protein [Staphylococcus epidermidis]MCG2405702.1 hypothetical protein [Staphylococcus epidermidis]MCG2494918.1 hypothetical protein [Staphylococcus epidermidis]